MRRLSIMFAALALLLLFKVLWTAGVWSALLLTCALAFVIAEMTDDTLPL
jgi:hypothetical protein